MFIEEEFYSHCSPEVFGWDLTHLFSWDSNSFPNTWWAKNLSHFSQAISLVSIAEGVPRQVTLKFLVCSFGGEEER